MAQPNPPSNDLLSTMFNMDDFTKFGSKKLWRLINLFLAEAFGTGILLFLLCGVVNTTALTNKEDIVAIALTGGLAVGTAVFCFGHVSGPHINPAISLAAVILGKMSLPLAAFFTVAQCIGSFSAYALSMAIMPSDLGVASTDAEFGARCCSVPNARLVWWQVVLAEFLGTSILTFAFCSAVDKRNQDKEDSVPLKFGMVLIALIIPIASYSGCSLNPARTFGPALYNLFWNNHWCYWAGPMLGGGLSALVYRYVFDPRHMEITQTIVPSPTIGCTGPTERMLGKNTYKFADDEP